MPVEKAPPTSTLGDAGLLTAELAEAWRCFQDVAEEGVRGQAIEARVSDKLGLSREVAARRLALAERVMRVQLDVSTLLSRLGLLAGPDPNRAPTGAGGRLISIVVAAVERLGVLIDDVLRSSRRDQPPARWPSEVPAAEPADRWAILASAAALLDLLLVDLLEQARQNTHAASGPQVEDLARARAGLAGLRRRFDDVPVPATSQGDQRRLLTRDLWISLLRAHSDADRSALAQAERLAREPVPPEEAGQRISALAVDPTVSDTARQVLHAAATALAGPSATGSAGAALTSPDGSLRIVVRTGSDGRIVLVFEADRSPSQLAAVRVRVATTRASGGSWVDLAAPLAATVSGAWRAGYDLGDGTGITAVELDSPRWLRPGDLTEEMIRAAFITAEPDPAATRAWRLIERSPDFPVDLRPAVAAAREHRERLSMR